MKYLNEKTRIANLKKLVGNNKSNFIKESKKPLLHNIILTEDDLSLVNGKRNGWTSFAIECLNESIFDDIIAYNLESYLNDNNIFADIFNVEYMGFLTGQIKIERSKIGTIIPFINEFLKNETK